MSGIKTVTRNKRALRDYFVVERYEAGLVLRGSEVKSLRDARANLADSHVEVVEGELFLVSCHISHYPFANIQNHDPVRPRKLLLNRLEIAKITRRITERGYTAIPLSIYFKNGRAKGELGLARGKRQVDKRHDIRKRDEARDAQRELKRRR